MGCCEYSKNYFCLVIQRSNTKLRTIELLVSSEFERIWEGICSCLI
jgi:hypothetical protein